MKRRPRDAGVPSEINRSRTLAPYGPLAMTARGVDREGQIAGKALPQRSAGLPETIFHPGTVDAACGSGVQRRVSAKPSAFKLPARAVASPARPMAEMASHAAAVSWTYLTGAPAHGNPPPGQLQ